MEWNYGGGGKGRAERIGRRTAKRSRGKREHIAEGMRCSSVLAPSLPRADACLAAFLFLVWEAMARQRLGAFAARKGKGPTDVVSPSFLFFSVFCLLARNQFIYV